MPRESLASLQPPTLPTSSTALKLPVQRALECLSVDLETELTRYRQSRQGTLNAPAPRGIAFRRRRKPIDLIRVEGRPGHEPMAESAEAAAAGLPLPPPLPPNPRLAAVEAVANASTVPTGADSSDAQMSLIELGTLESATGEQTSAEEAALTHYQAIPEDYLETTEALLRSAAAQEPSFRSDDTTYSPTLAHRLATPLGMGALLLLLVSSASLGYLLTNPRAIGHLWSHPAVQSLRGQPAVSDPEAASSGTFEPGLDGLGPNLSEQEFVDLNLSTLSTLPTTAGAPAVASTPLTMVGPSAAPNPSGSPATAPRPASPVNPTITAPVQTAPRAPSRPPSTVPTAVRPVPAPARPAPAAPAPASPSTPARAAAPSAAPVTAAPPPLPAPPQATAAAPAETSAETSYYVITDYTGDQSLSNARNAVGEAYVRNFPTGARIQMGAFEQESSARELVQELQQQGIPAEVYQP